MLFYKKRVAFEVSATPTTPTFAATLKPNAASLDAFVSGCSALQPTLDFKQCMKLAKTYGDLLLKMVQRIRVKVKFDSPSFVPKPLCLQPSLRASTTIQETIAYKEAVFADTHAIDTYQDTMRNVMVNIACEELLSAQASQYNEIWYQTDPELSEVQPDDQRQWRQQV